MDILINHMLLHGRSFEALLQKRPSAPKVPSASGKIIIEYSALASIFGFNLGLGWVNKIIVCPDLSNPIEINLSKIYSDIQIHIVKDHLGLVNIIVNKGSNTYTNCKPEWCETKQVYSIKFSEFDTFKCLPSTINIKFTNLDQIIFSICKIESSSNTVYAFCYDDEIFTQMDVNEIIKCIAQSFYE